MQQVEPNFKDSARVFASFMAVWCVLAVTVFWMEPVLIYQFLVHQRLGLGEVTWTTYGLGVAAWLLPLAFWQISSLKDDARNGFGPGAHHSAYDLHKPQRRVGPSHYEEFDYYFPKWAMRLTLHCLGGGGIVIFSGILCSALVRSFVLEEAIDPPEYVDGLVLLAGLIWLTAASFTYVTVTMAFTEDKASILFMPWRQKWTWLYLLITLPFLAFYLVAFVRLVVTRDRGLSALNVLRELRDWPQSRQRP